MNKELMSAVYQGVIEIVSRSTHIQLIISQFCQFVGINFLQTCGKDHTFPLSDSKLEVAGNIQVLITGITTFLFLRILQSPVPVRTENKVVFLVALHI